MNLLHITNGSAANQVLQDADIAGELLGWDDPLHQGPVPEGLALRELSAVRARFIVEQGWSDLLAVQRKFQVRDQTLETMAASGEVVLWSSFELYDQLHLLQLLGWFEQHGEVIASPSVVWLDDYFSNQDPDEIRQSFAERAPVSTGQQSIAADIWQAFRYPQPNRLLTWSARVGPELPFMQRALRRILEEYPDLESGVSRTERQILQVLFSGAMEPTALFRTTQALESPAFMGDWSFWSDLARLERGPKPAVRVVGGGRFVCPPKVAADSPRFRDQLLELTDFGSALAVGNVGDFFVTNGSERWVGGVRLTPDNDWRWDSNLNTLVPQGK